MAAQGLNDYSGSYSELRDALDRETGGAYRAFVRGLPANYAATWRDIAFGYLALALGLALAALAQPPWAQVLAAVAGAAWVGYWIAYLQLFIHEAAHYNLAATKAWNDRLCDAFIAWQVGTSAKDYRATHFQHHRALGRTDDSETSYFHALTPRFVLEMLTGIHALRIFLARRREAGAGRSPAPLLRGLFLHGLLLAPFAWAGAWGAAAAWILGMGLAYPLFATLRQLLEHRSLEADPAADYAHVPHGPLARLFGDGPLASTFGGAGFNRHLLHHWEPQVPYPSLAELERYLERTSAGGIIAARRASYMRVLVEIWRNDNRPR